MTTIEGKTELLGDADVSGGFRRTLAGSVVGAVLEWYGRATNPTACVPNASRMPVCGADAGKNCPANTVAASAPNTANSAALMGANGSTTPVAIYLALCALISVAAVATGPETRGTDLRA